MPEEISQMSNEATEMRKQLVGYADAITAFATVQLIGFTLLMTHGDCFTKNVLSGIWFAVSVGGLVNVAYLALIFLCHHQADRIANHSLDIFPELRGVRILRYAIVVTDLLVTLLLPLAINYGWRHTHFFIDCKAT